MITHPVEKVNPETGTVFETGTVLTY